MNLTAWLPTAFAGAAAFGAWASAMHNRKASEHAANRTADEKHYETDANSLVNFNRQLLEERRDMLGKLASIQEQVANKHATNLRDDLTEALEWIRLLRGDVREVREAQRALERRVTDSSQR